MFCTNCGASVSDGARFCPECGAARVPARPERDRCPACGAALEPDSVFCVDCGQRVSGTSDPGTNAPRYSGPRPAGTARTAVTESAGRRGKVSVTAQPVARIFGIPLRGKAAWIALAVVAAVLVGLGLYLNRAGDGDGGGADTPHITDVQMVTAERQEGNVFLDRGDEAEQLPEEEPAPEEESTAPEEEPAPDEPEPELEAPQEPDGAPAPLPYADSLGRVEATDFAWIADARSGGLTGSFLGNDELIGRWKGEIIYDDVWELVYVTIDENASVSIEPAEINYGDGWEDETGKEPYLFDGMFDVSSVSGTGNYGSISLYLFLESYGAQYGVGAFALSDGDSADVYLVRP